ncbi:MBL fold metallo-hydrolase [Nocardioides carbamazepini]|uniref:MBL fold metallo-hydrolase n=1 Tax=Nocardioides carbamazepini TaxID=2854259 RepID=UPI00214A0592|nr:MBL fold metallo-hydrolase [Nocardioides carbamazepini]MCR1784021.1 MBL fold metallo-hydrolase [Nocardioides carbamazepini]
MEISPGIHRIEAPLGERYVALYLIIGDASSMLVDTGLDESVAGSLLPYLRSIGHAPERLAYVVNTHGDFDHVGGNAALRVAAPDAKLLVGRGDVHLVENVETMIAQRYGEFAAPHGFDEPDDTKTFIRSVTRTTTVDLPVDGGETFDLGGRTVQVLHVPGHSDGHLAVHDLTTNTLMIGDAVLSDSVLTADQHPAFPPTYRKVPDYRATIGTLTGLRPAILATAHYPLHDLTSGAEFLAGSLAYADRVDAVVGDIVTGASAPLTLMDIVRASHPRLGPWDPVSAQYLVYPVLGHLEDLESRGVVTRQVPSTGHHTWTRS